MTPKQPKEERTRALLIDDDVELCDLLMEFLADHEFEIDAVHDGAEGLQAARRGAHEILILDMMLPGANGFEVLKALRETSSLPVLMLTARGSDEDRIAGLESGADDYLAKPFNPLELVARLRAILRRVGGATPEPMRPIGVGEIELRPASRELWVRGTRLHCTDAEFDLLERLLRHPGQIVSRQSLVESVLGRPFDPRDRSLDVHVSNLRKRLAEAGVAPVPIVTVRGEGYLFAPPPGEETQS